MIAGQEDAYKYTLQLPGDKKSSSMNKKKQESFPPSIEIRIPITDRGLNFFPRTEKCRAFFYSDGAIFFAEDGAKTYIPVRLSFSLPRTPFFIMAFGEFLFLHTFFSPFSHFQRNKTQQLETKRASKISL